MLVRQNGSQRGSISIPSSSTDERHRIDFAAGFGVIQDYRLDSFTLIPLFD